ncbi:hypothetical protein BDQ17DRAFT_1352135 [Cyathus striatus]|nr:hypothetical protein BDQ17DRAFT_1352135 [Cyathus striatus]
MPAPVSSPSLARPVENSASQKPRPRTRKTRIIRRRGRAHDGIETDDEIEREIGSDSESDVDDASSSESETEDSDTEPASEDVADTNHARVRISTSIQSTEAPVKVPAVQAPFFAPTSNWSEMVADETTNGPADLPVIDFSEFDSHAIPAAAPTSRKVKKPSKKSRPAPAPELTQVPAPQEPARIDDSEPTPAPERPSGPSHPKRPYGQSARQAYQQRLETDPSFVPKVGGFWGHDDRLMDKDLRSLSTWWRGRWQGNLRGRGRGRGGFAGSHGTPREGGEQKDTELPPIEKQWTHDGFEEMKKREDQPPASQGQQSNGSFRGGHALRGARGGFVPNRGGGFSPRSRGGSPLLPPGRVWYAQKPELMWTKQHEAFLYFDTSLKPRPGQPGGIRVKLPGKETQLARVTSRFFYSTRSTSNVDEILSFGSDVGERALVVRLPKRTENAKAAEPPVTGEEPPLDEVFTVRPNLVPSNPIPLPVPSVTNEAVGPSPAPELANKPQVESVPVVQHSIISQLEQLNVAPKTPDPERQLQTELAVLRRPSLDGSIVPEPLSGTQDERPPLAPLQTVFTPPPPPISQPSPAYGSPYGYAPPLPPGVALNQHGIPYEIATGRPVYLQPPTMYNARTYIPSHTPTFVPGHMHHPSAVSPDFLAQTPSHTPPVNGFIDPATGTPIFSFPRQTSRIEIRAPTEENSKASGSKSAPRISSTLRTSAPSFEPPRPQENDYYYDGSYEAAEGAPIGEDGQVMGYTPYQQHYYYPEAYGYPQYMDMSQAGQYDMYPMEHQTPPGTVYY